MAYDKYARARGSRAQAAARGAEGCGGPNAKEHTAKFEVFPFSKSRIQRPPAREGRIGGDQGCVQAASFWKSPSLTDTAAPPIAVEGGLENLSLLRFLEPLRRGTGRYWAHSRGKQPR